MFGCKMIRASTTSKSGLSIKAITLLLFTAWTSAAQNRCASVPAPAVWFTFDEPLFDAKAQHSPPRTAGIVGRALRFDGKAHYWEAPRGMRGLDVGEGNFTIELWIRTELQAGSVNVVDKRSPLPLGYLIFLYRGFPGFQIANGDHNSYYSRTKSIADGRWHHIAGVARRLPPTPFQLYIDGVLDPAPSNNVPLANLDVADALWLGRHHKNGRVTRDDIYFKGDVDELAIFHRALTASEVQAIHRAGAAGKCKAGAKP